MRRLHGWDPDSIPRDSVARSRWPNAPSESRDRILYPNTRAPTDLELPPNTGATCSRPFGPTIRVTLPCEVTMRSPIYYVGGLPIRVYLRQHDLGGCRCGLWPGAQGNVGADH